MRNHYKNLLNNITDKPSDSNMYDKEGCAATGRPICDFEPKFDCENCPAAKHFIKTCSKLDQKSLDSLFKEAETRLNRSKEQLDDILTDLIEGIEVDKYLKAVEPLIKPYLKHYNINYNPNIHLSKAEKAKIKQDNIRKYNTPKKPYIYKGNELIDTDWETYINVYWNDNTVTSCNIKRGDRFNFGYGLLIATAKKFVKDLDFDFLETILHYNKAAIISVLELFIKNTAGTKCLSDIRKEAKNN